MTAVLKLHSYKAWAGAGAVAYLAPLVLKQEPKLKRQVCCALAQIAKHSVDMAEVVVEAEVFPKILTCLKFPDELVRKHAATVVREVSPPSHPVLPLFMVCNLVNEWTSLVLPHQPQTNPTGTHQKLLRSRCLDSTGYCHVYSCVVNCLSRILLAYEQQSTCSCQYTAALLVQPRRGIHNAARYGKLKRCPL